jgi:hypothetical protein
LEGWQLRLSLNYNQIIVRGVTDRQRNRDRLSLVARGDMDYRAKADERGNAELDDPETGIRN